MSDKKSGFDGDQTGKSGGNRSPSPIKDNANTMTFAFLVPSPYEKAFSRAYKLLLVLYLVIALSAIGFNLGITTYGKWIAEFGQLIVPSILPTSQITSMVESSAFALTLSWIWGVVMFVPLAWLLVKDGGHAINVAHLRKKLSAITGAFLWIGPISGVYVMAFFAPINPGGYEGVISLALRNVPLFVIAWGMVICTAVWMVLAVSSISLVLILTKSSEEL